jgi:3-oxoacyl-[acyl-carrier-protein] synthase II
MSVLVTGVGLALGELRDPRALREERGPGAVVEPAAILGHRGLLYKDRATQLALWAALDALDAAGLLDDRALNVSGERFAVVASSNFGNLDTVCRVAAQIAEEGTSAISPMGLPNASSNVVASSVSIRFGLRGPNLMLCNGATGGLDAVHVGSVLIRAGRADRALIIGVETRNEVVERVLGAAAADLLDGAVGLVLESAAAGRERQAEPVGALGPYAVDLDLERCLATVTDPDDIGLWLVPEGYNGPAPSSVETASRRDLSASFGRCSGALGVLQCATGLAWLAQDGAKRVVATAGGCGGDPVAALVLTATDVRGTRGERVLRPRSRRRERVGHAPHAPPAPAPPPGGLPGSTPRARRAGRRERSHVPRVLRDDACPSSAPARLGGQRSRLAPVPRERPP